MLENQDKEELKTVEVQDNPYRMISIDLRFWSSFNFSQYIPTSHCFEQSVYTGKYRNVHTLTEPFFIYKLFQFSEFICTKKKH